MSAPAAIAPAVAAETAALYESFTAAQPFKHVVVDELLRPDICRRLADEFPPFDIEGARNEIGKIGNKSVHAGIRSLGGTYVEFDGLMRSSEFLRWLSQATGIPDLLYDPEYEGGGTHENRSGQYLDVHVDFNYHSRTRYHRRLNLILFLNETWRAEWGGVLELHRNPWAPLAEDLVGKVVPRQNRCIIFETTETSWHGFDPIVQPPSGESPFSRWTLAVYFYTRERPTDQMAPSHGTFYVPCPLPESIQAGTTLSEEDMYQICVCLARRDQQIQFLHQRELEISEGLSVLEAPTAHLLLNKLQQVRELLKRWSAWRIATTDRSRQGRED